MVKATINFNDVVEKTKDGKDTPRQINDVFYCTKERYEFLKSHKAVTLMGITKIETPSEAVDRMYTDELKKKKPKSEKRNKTINK